MDTPILFIIFNRPDTTARVFAAIRQARPKRLFIAADGPRESRQGEAEKCAAARKIVENIDWDCEVSKDFSEANLGCKRRVSSAISWFFSNVEAGIILEDDCLPEPSFFPFCAELLEKYKDDGRVMHISGDNFLFGKIKIREDYYFSRLSSIWGWATWRRAWKFYDPDIKSFPAFAAGNKIAKIFPGRFMQKRWLEFFQTVYEKKLDTWDYQWQYAILEQNGLCINPRANLISNIGFLPEATHTAGKRTRFADMPTSPLKIAAHPAAMEPNEKADQLIMKKNLNMNLLYEFKKRLIKILRPAK